MTYDATDVNVFQLDKIPLPVVLVFAAFVRVVTQRFN